MTNLSGGKVTEAGLAQKSSQVPKELRVIRLALFGLGRAGSIHMENILGNPRIKLAYVLEADTSKWDVCKEEWNLSDDVIFLEPKVGINKAFTELIFLRPTHV